MSPDKMSPDLFVDQLPDGKFKVRLAIPQSRIDSFYGDWVRDQIERRRAEVISVATAIFDHQRRFLVEGPNSIAPLRMQQIADACGLHVTTVSRAVSDKWVQTPRGLYPLKQFFIAESRNADSNATEIQNKIQELIDEEDKSMPHRDDQLVAQLEKHGFAVARRTITKYRKKLGIPSSRQRRRW